MHVWLHCLSEEGTEIVFICSHVTANIFVNFICNICIYICTTFINERKYLIPPWRPCAAPKRSYADVQTV